MVVDSSAIVAAFAHEPGWEAISRAIATAPECHMSAFTLFECRVVIGKLLGQARLLDLDLLLLRASITVHPFDTTQAALAHDAYVRFGKGTGHPAQLNLGDCASYALATSLGLPLLYKGNDFSKTDLPSAL